MIKNKFIKQLFTLACITACGCDLSAQPIHYYPTEQSLVQYNAPEWFKDAKIGYWVHWGVYSVPAFAGDHAAEWYGRWMYVTEEDAQKDPSLARGLATAAHHRQTYGDPKDFGYKEFIPMWKAEKFDANQWADLFTAGGAKFFTMMAMHHDNYPLWDSKTTPLNSVNSGPKRDFVGEMEQAIRARGLHFGVSNHSAFNSRFFSFKHSNYSHCDQSPIYGYAETGVDDVADWWAHSTELVERYRPDLVWYDWCWNGYPFTQQTRMNFCSWYYNKANDWGVSTPYSPEVVVAYKSQGKLPDGSAILDLERGGMQDIYPHTWMTDTSLGLHSWSFAPSEEYRSADQVIDMLLDLISKNGVLQLNIGPKADGSIPDVAKESILSIGDWLKINGEGVYSTRPWTIYGEGPTHPAEQMDGDYVIYTKDDIRFTRSKDMRTLYIHALVYNKSYTIESLHKGALDMSGVKEITLLDGGEVVSYSQNNKHLTLKMPRNASKEAAAYTFKVSFEDKIPNINR